MITGQSLEEEKRRVRRETLTARKNLTAGGRAEACRQIELYLTQQQAYKQADWVLCYVSYREEVKTGPFLERAFADGKRVYVPKVLSGLNAPAPGRGPAVMDFYEIRSLSQLRPGFRGILEPEEGRPRFDPDADLHTKGLMVLPGAAFDTHGGRIGYGGGYYDRYLDRLQAAGKRRLCVLAGICFSCQLTEQVPRAAYDETVDLVITETGIWHSDGIRKQ